MTTQPLPKTIFVIDDGSAHDFAEKLALIFPEAEVRGFRWEEDAVTAIRSGLLPDLIVSDSSDGGGDVRGRVSDVLGLLKAIQETAPHRSYPVILMVSFAYAYAATAQENILSKLKFHGSIENVSVGAAYTNEMLNIADLFSPGGIPKAALPKRTEFRDFLGAEYGYRLPYTTEDVLTLVASRADKAPQDVVALVEGRRMNEEEGLLHLRGLMHDYLDRFQESVVIPEDRMGLEGLMVRFARAVGRPVSGPVAFSLEEVARFRDAGQKPILLLGKAKEEDVIAAFRHVAAVIVMEGHSSGHLEIVARAHGVSSLLGYLPPRTELNRWNTAVVKKSRHALQLDGEVQPDFSEALKAEGAVLGASASDGQMVVTRTLGTGDIITISPRERAFYPAALAVRADVREPDWFYPPREWLLNWCKQLGCHVPRFKANIDALAQMDINEAHGIGLVRTEHLMRTNPQQLAAFRAFLGGDERALSSLQQGWCEDYAVVLNPLRFNDNYPVRIRLLDAPPAEFLNDKLQAQLASDVGTENIRGVQLAVKRPALYEAQIRAIFAAYKHLQNKVEYLDDRPHPPCGPVEIMVPTVCSPYELLHVKAIVQQLAPQYGLTEQHYRFGTMMEMKDILPHCEEVARICDFVSFGSNDLTEQVLGISRNDSRARHQAAKASGRMQDPFVELHHEVLQVMKNAVTDLRQANPNLEIDLCGEHATNLPSLMALRSLKLDGVSLPPSPYNHHILPMLVRLEIFDLYHAEADASARLMMRPKAPEQAL